MKPAYALTLCLGLLEGTDAGVVPCGSSPKTHFSLSQSDDSFTQKEAVLPVFKLKSRLAEPNLRRRAYKTEESYGSDDSDDSGDGTDNASYDVPTGNQATEYYEEPMMAPTYARTGEAPVEKPKSKSKSEDGTVKTAKHGGDDNSESGGHKQKGKDKNKGSDSGKHSGDDDSSKSRSKTEDSTRTSTLSTTTLRSATSSSSTTTSTALSDDSSRGGKGKGKGKDNSGKHSGDDDGSKSRTRIDDSTKTSTSGSIPRPTSDDSSKGSGKGKGNGEDDSGKHSGDDDGSKSRTKTDDSTKTRSASPTKTSTKSASSTGSGKGKGGNGKHDGSDDATKSRTRVEDSTKTQTTQKSTATPTSKGKGKGKGKGSEDDTEHNSSDDSKKPKGNPRRIRRASTVHQSGKTFDADSAKGGGKTSLGYGDKFPVPKLNQGYIQAVPPQESNSKPGFKVKPKPQIRDANKKVRPVTPPLHKRDHVLSLRAAAPLNSVAIDRAKWIVTCDSVHEGDECKNAIDGNGDTFWHTQWESSEPPPPHTITVDLRKVYNVNGVSMLPRQDDSPNGYIAQHQVFLSKDNKTWGSPIAYGNWYDDRTVKYANFDTTPARYVRLVAITEVNGNPWTSIAELNVFQANDYIPPKPSMGAWGPTINFPIIPVAGTVDPTTGKVIVWSSWARDTMSGGPGGLTLTSTWDPATDLVSERDVTETDHDMFCPGISLDGNGQLVVTGGNNAERTSLFDPVSQTWVPGPNMNIARGYQSSATTSTGKVFTIGGSWSGGQSFKNGEVYDPKKKTWTMLNKADVQKMLTNDAQGLFRSDNHAWLFGWKSGTVFQAGPSTAMNWYYTSQKDGNVKTAGQRSSDRGVASDAMCGNAVMFDAVKGKILTHGGTPNYQDSDATTDAHIITLGAHGVNVTTSYASEGLFFPRVFHSSVVLPNGNVFITGGQEYAVPFDDNTPQLQPEMYLPEEDRFVLMKPNNIVRVYHSIAFLLPDGRVFNGGGGLCGGCDTNHFDAQLYSPPYLFDSKGKLAKRPKISSVSVFTIKVGGTVTVQTNGAIAQASLVRYGTATHTVNSDQRRIPLTLSNAGKNAYSFKVPSDPGVALPGYWMLFVMDKNGVPSVASTIKVTGS
ncbi:galactose oxidase precursor [Fusarium heterosporum]|uniref:Galactose oxidase n=1 Tax=Fusarium heterosporum TaxID=42747 RepID=A0A8H5TMU4_FUSHE|nr:galactose oxidase precursor [Fusarium heterosporum]